MCENTPFGFFWLIWEHDILKPVWNTVCYIYIFTYTYRYMFIYTYFFKCSHKYIYIQYIFICTHYIDMRYKKHNMFFSRHLKSSNLPESPHIPLSTPSTQKIGDLKGDLWTPWTKPASASKLTQLQEPPMTRESKFMLIFSDVGHPTFSLNHWSKIHENSWLRRMTVFRPQENGCGYQIDWHLQTFAARPAEKLLDGEELFYHHDVTGLGGTNMCCWKYGGSGCLGVKISQVDWLIGNTPVDLVVFAFKIWMCVFTSHSIRQYPSI